jgi:hypothetical protein
MMFGSLICLPRSIDPAEDVLCRVESLISGLIGDRLSQPALTLDRLLR